MCVCMCVRESDTSMSGEDVRHLVVQFFVCRCTLQEKAAVQTGLTASVLR